MGEAASPPATAQRDPLEEEREAAARGSPVASEDGSLPDAPGDGQDVLEHETVDDDVGSDADLASEEGLEATAQAAASEISPVASDSPGVAPDTVLYEDDDSEGVMGDLLSRGLGEAVSDADPYGYVPYSTPYLPREKQAVEEHWAALEGATQRTTLPADAGSAAAEASPRGGDSLQSLLLPAPLQEPLGAFFADAGLTSDQVVRENVSPPVSREPGNEAILREVRKRLQSYTTAYAAGLGQEVDLSFTYSSLMTVTDPYRAPRLELIPEAGYDETAAAMAGPSPVTSSPAAIDGVHTPTSGERVVSGPDSALRDSALEG